MKHYIAQISKVQKKQIIKAKQRYIVINANFIGQPQLHTWRCVIQKKNKNLFGFSYYGQKQRVHNMLQQQCMNSAQLSYRGYTNKKYQFLN